MAGRAVGGRGVSEIALALAHLLDQLAQVGRAGAGSGYHHERRIGDQRHRLERGLRVHLEAREQGRVHRHRTLVAHQQRIAVGLGGRRGLSGKIAAGPGLVLHHHGLTEHGLQPCGKGARDRVGAPTGRVGNQQPEWAAAAAAACAAAGPMAASGVAATVAARARRRAFRRVWCFGIVAFLPLLLGSVMVSGAALAALRQPAAAGSDGRPRPGLGSAGCPQGWAARCGPRRPRRPSRPRVPARPPARPQGGRSAPVPPAPRRRPPRRCRAAGPRWRWRSSR